MHKVLPGETVPFRVAFEGVATVSDGSIAANEQAGVFDPDSVVQLTLTEDVASYEVEAKALVTGRNLERLVVSDLAHSPGESGSGRITATISNRGTETATIPVAVVSLLNVDGEVLWVEPQPLSNAIRSQRADEIEFALPDLAQVEVIDVDGIAFDNGRSNEGQRLFTSTVSLPLNGPLQGAGQIDSIALTVITFERGDS